MKRALFLWLLLCGMANAATYRVATHDEVFQAGTRQLASRIYYPTSATGAPQWVGKTRCLRASKASRMHRWQRAVSR